MAPRFAPWLIRAYPPLPLYRAAWTRARVLLLRNSQRHSPSKSISPFTPVFAGYAVNALMAALFLEILERRPRRGGRGWIGQLRLARVRARAGACARAVGGAGRSRRRGLRLGLLRSPDHFGGFPARRSGS